MIKVHFISELSDKYNFNKLSLSGLVLKTMERLEITNGIIEVILLDPDAIKTLNQKYRQIDKPTDVLSFPQAEIPGNRKIIGSIVISPELVSEMQETLTEVLVHGCLHLAGYDHETDQKKWEEALNRIGGE